MSPFQILRIVHLRLEKIQKNFLWGGGTLESKPHLVKWATICSNRRKGGLGVRHLHSLNKAILCKWNWCYVSKRKAFWRQIICSKYGDMERVGALRKREATIALGYGRP